MDSKYRQIVGPPDLSFWPGLETIPTLIWPHQLSSGSAKVIANSHFNGNSFTAAKRKRK